MYQIFTSEEFVRQLRRLVKKDKSLKLRINKTIKIVSKDLDHPSLRLHKLKGAETWSVSVSKSIRIILRITGDKIYFLRVGTHDEVY